ncbi:hypothetical protein GCM10023144_10680 [Pigmentiphaga soli]|uniref:UPF0391 membrane protein GCM10023144_10680 n=1 Tax=Pigmentiphaga soli TaxID=1007095 RepID=A0ABP8GM56_9BURK
MLRWATVFFAIPLFVALFGVGDFAAGAATIATALFAISLCAFLLTFIIKLPEDDEEDRQERPYEGELSN